MEVLLPAKLTVRVVAPKTEGARRAVTRWRTVPGPGGPGEPGGPIGPGWLLEVEPVTGRSHQIRSALAGVGASILGDLKYGAAEPLADRSIALHAVRLTVTHPTRDERLSFEVAPPERPWWAAAGNR